MIRSHVLTTQDAARWRAVLPADLSVTRSVEYARLGERETGWPARLFVVESQGRPVAAYPFCLRPINTLPFAAGVGEACWDTCTPEYTGPLALGPEPSAWPDGQRFADLFAAYCRANGIVAEFAHLNPWSVAPELLDAGCVEPNREIVYIDLTWDEDRIWTKSLTSDARRQTKQAQRAGVRVRRAESAEDVLAFHRLYTQTMERRQALERYYFAPEYFLACFETLPENSFSLLAEYEGRLVAGGLYFHDRAEVYWHLSATDLEFAHVRPVNAVVYESICWGLRQGKRRMILGGGYQPDDGVYRFKANFSPLRARFCTYRRVHDADTYTTLTRAWCTHHDAEPSTSFFPTYRSAAPTPVPAANSLSPLPIPTTAPSRSG